MDKIFESMPEDNKKIFAEIGDDLFSEEDTQETEFDKLEDLEVDEEESLFDGE